jgi:hypothetical protein
MKRALYPVEEAFARLATIHRRRQPDLALFPRTLRQRAVGVESGGLVAESSAALGSGTAAGPSTESSGGPVVTPANTGSGRSGSRPQLP